MSRTDRAASHLPPLQVRHLGTLAYGEALALQADLRERRQREEIADTLLLLQHPPVYTRGRRALDRDLPLGAGFYSARGIEIFPTDRGGRVTYHGPGQLVGYPIMRVEDVGVHLRTIERAIVSALACYGVEARSRCEEGVDYTGVWVQERKIASIGVHLSRGVSTHGFAVNVVNDLGPFAWIVPCGLDDARMTSLERELGAAPAGGFDAFARLAARCFCEAYGREPAQDSLKEGAQAEDEPTGREPATRERVAT